MTAPRARAQGPKCQIHTASTKGGAGAMAGRLTNKTYRQTETATKRETQRREGLGKEGRDLKNQGAEQRPWRRALSCWS